MEQSKKIIIGLILIVIFILIISITSWYVQSLIYTGNACTCFIPIPILIPLIASVGLLIGTLLYYIFSPKFEKKLDRKIILQLLDKDGAEIISLLLDREGSLKQSEITKITGLTKVRVFRALEKLKNMKIVQKQSHGKINLIELNEEIKQILK